MIISANVGPQAPKSVDGSGGVVGTVPRLGNQQDLMVSELHGRYYEQAYRKNLFLAANSAGVTTVAFTSGTTTSGLTGVILSNAPGNTVNLVLNKIGIAFPVINTTTNSALLACGFNSTTAVTHTTPLTPRSSFIGVGPTPQGLVDATATVPTAPNTTHLLLSMGSATTLPTAAFFDLEGSVILPPGAYACLMTSAASAASGFAGSISWEEVPV
jgi:hypothetical protein